MMANRIGNALTRQLLRPAHRSTGLRFSSRADPHEKVVIFMIDITSREQQLINERERCISEIFFGRNPEFPFPGNVKQKEIQELVSAREEQQPPLLEQPKHLWAQTNLRDHCPDAVHPPITFASDLPTKQRQPAQVITEQDEQPEHAWTLRRVDSVRILCEEVNELFGKNFGMAGHKEATVTMISLCSTATPPAEADEEEEEEIHSFQTFAVDEEDEDDKAYDKEAAEAEEEQQLMLRACSFVRVANAICKELKEFDHWADFIDPRNGRPYWRKLSRFNAGKHAVGRRSLTLELDPARRYTGFRVSNSTSSSDHLQDGQTPAQTDGTAPCKLIEKAHWEKPDADELCWAQIFTNAPADSPVLQHIVAKFGPRTPPMPITTMAKTDDNGEAEDGDVNSE